MLRVIIDKQGTGSQKFVEKLRMGGIVDFRKIHYQHVKGSPELDAAFFHCSKQHIEQVEKALQSCPFVHEIKLVSEDEVCAINKICLPLNDLLCSVPQKCRVQNCDNFHNLQRKSKNT